MEQYELTEDEQALVATAALCGPFPPKAEYLPECHRLYERGWLDIGLTDNHVIFSLSRRGRMALELDAALDERMRAVN